MYEGGYWIRFHKEAGGNPGYLFYPDPVPDATIYLRIDRLGTKFTGYFSIDGIAWTVVGEQTISLNDAKIGVAARNGYSGLAEIPADSDYFQLSTILRIYLPYINK